MKTVRKVKFQAGPASLASPPAARKKIKMSETGTPVISSDSEEEPTQQVFPMTQAFVEEEEELAQAKVNQIKRKQVLESSTDDEAEPEEEEAPEGSFLAALELYWQDYFIHLLLPTLIMCLERATETRQLKMKRVFLKTMDLWKDALTTLYHGIDKSKKFGKFSWRAFCEKLHDAKLYTTFCTTKITPEAMIIFDECLKAVTAGASLSQPTTETTTTSSMTAPTPVPPADVPPSRSSEPMEDAFEKVFGVGSSRQSTGCISQTTCSQRDGILYTLKSPGETGYMVSK